MKPAESLGKFHLIPSLQSFQKTYDVNKNFASWQVKEPQDILVTSIRGIHPNIQYYRNVWWKVLGLVSDLERRLKFQSEDSL